MKNFLKAFVQPSFFGSIFLIIYCLLLWVVNFQFKSSDQTTNQSFIEISNSFLFNNLFLNIICFIITIINLVLIYQYKNKFSIISGKSFLPVFIFLQLMAVWGEIHTNIVANLSLTLIILSFYSYAGAIKNRNGSEYIFLGSLLLGIVSIVFHPLILILPITWIGLFVLQSFSLRTLLSSILGWTTPYILFIAEKMIIEKTIVQWTYFNDIKLNFDAILNFSIAQIVYFAIVGLVFLISLIYVLSSFSKISIQSRLKLNFIILFTFLFIFLFLLFYSFFILPTLMFMLTILLSYSFTYQQNKFNNFVFLLFCLTNLVYLITKLLGY